MKSEKEKRLRERVLDRIEHNWPTHIKEIVKDLGYEVNNLNIKKVAYHVKKLEKEEKVRVKRIGQALVVWPYDIEKLRIIHELLKED